ncbi:MAG: hypothetical protein U1E82_03505 [Nitrosomonas sp.]
MNLLSWIKQIFSDQAGNQLGIRRKESKSLDFIFEQDDINCFKHLCQFVWIQGEPIPLIFDLSNHVYANQKITLPMIERLVAIGLVDYAPEGYVKKKLGKHTRFFYHGRLTKIGFAQDAGNQLDLGVVLLTSSGKKLYATLSPIRNQQFYEYVIQHWFQKGLLLSSPLGSPQRPHLVN